MLFVGFVSFDGCLGDLVDHFNLSDEFVVERDLDHFGFDGEGVFLVDAEEEPIFHQLHFRNIVLYRFKEILTHL